uniref:Preprotein-translocase subunit g n=1 Tax=Periphykon beckeri TaxID=2006982 RepID=A0A1Z1M3T1_9FLOR|nr:preprotein-translocase subunit g [Periphykon beckeri]ARW60424.1 preprotein-translocase subunit g [Periphykon beckeri]
MLKFFWYLSSLLTVLCILLNTTNKNSLRSSVSQNQLFNFRSNQLFMQRLTAFSIFMFFVFTIFSLL